MAQSAPRTTNVDDTPMTGVVANELFRRAEAAAAEGQYEEAGEHYERLLLAGVEPGLMLYRLGVIANARGLYDEAWEYHNEAIRQNPGLAARISPEGAKHHDLVCRGPYDQEEPTSCPICGHTGCEPMQVINCLAWPTYHPALAPVRRWMRCDDCGHGFVSPRPTQAALSRLYEDTPPDTLLAVDYFHLSRYSDIVHRFWELMPGGDLLDIGSAQCYMCAVAMDFGYNAVAMDLVPLYAEYARRAGCDFIQGDVATYDFADRQFDIVTAGDIIEHVLDPVAVVRRMAALLKPSGLLWLSTPNHEGAWTRLARDKDPMWAESEHVQFFSLRSLKRLLADCGLTVVDYRMSQNWMGCGQVLARFL